MIEINPLNSNFQQDTDPNEDLDITPPWLRGRDRFTDDLEDKVELNKAIKKFPFNRYVKYLFQAD